MLQVHCARAATYQVLDQVLADRGVSLGTRGVMFRVVDGLRASSTRTDELRRAERISLCLHKLGWAQHRQDAVAADEALDELKALAVSCLNSRICRREF